MRTLVADSTQIAQFMECQTQWRYGSLENLTAFIKPPKDAMLMGSFGHKLLERYYKQSGQMNDRMEYALQFDPESEIQNCTCGHPKSDHANGILILDYCKSCFDHGNGCGTFIPVPFDLSEENRKIVRNSFVNYCYTYSQNDFQPESPDHVEIGFSHPLVDDSQRLYVLEGRIDLKGFYQNLATIVDHKFQMRMHKLYSKSIQFRNYAMVSNSLMMIINYIRFNKTVTKDTFQREVVCFSPADFTRWRRVLIGIYDKMWEAKDSGHFDQNWSSCSGRYGYPCEYSPMCEQSNQDLIVHIKNNQFVQKEAWKPW